MYCTNVITYVERQDIWLGGFGNNKESGISTYHDHCGS